MNRPTGRQEELDFAKAIMIVLMVAFHLGWFTESHPYAKAIVYTFHMPVFLLISGYFCRVAERRKMMERLLWLAIPYIVMETGYILMCTQLPVKEHLDAFNLETWLYHTFIHPLGPYWYIHTLGICMAVSHLTFRYNLGRSTVGNLIISLLVLALLKRLVLMENAMYFMTGIALGTTHTRITKVVTPSWLSLLPLAWLLCYEENMSRGCLAGVAITWLAFSICLKLWPMARKGWGNSLWTTLGRNTFSILLFSPIFTLLCKELIPIFRWDPTRLTYMMAATTISLAGCLILTKIFDWIGLSRFFFGKKKVLYLPNSH